jgi:eIF3 subunit 6 N terminal domain
VCCATHHTPHHHTHTHQHTTHHNNTSAEMEDRREAVVARLEQLQIDCSTIIDLISNATLVKQLRSEKSFTPQYLQEKYGITPEMVEVLYQYAKFQFECGHYAEAAEYLFHYRSLRYWCYYPFLPASSSPFSLKLRFSPLPSLICDAARTQIGISQHCGANLQQKFLCKTGMPLLKI